MNEMTNIVSREQIVRLENAMRELPQAQDMVTDHYFADGMYCRKLWRPAGTVIVGKVHKKEHFFICAMGEIRAWTESGMRTLKAGDVIESKPGTKRVTLALTDAVGITVHKTNETELDAIEKELIEDSEISLFDARNELRKLS